MKVLKNEDDLLYIPYISSIDSRDPFNVKIYYGLQLVAGKEYIAPDYTDDEGYVTFDAFVNEVQYDSFIQFADEESFLSAAEDNGYEVIDYKGDIYQYGVYPYKRINIEDAKVMP